MATNENIITVKNAEGNPDTTAEILIQNKIDYTPKVSVIIPIYNTEKYLRECLDSVVNQTLKEIEIICVNDGSTDSSLEILKEYAERDNRFTIITQKNLHAGVARNAGLSQAKGEYLSFLDSDDWFELNMLEEMSKKASKNGSNVIICEANFIQVNTSKTGFTLVNKYMLKNRETFSCRNPEIAKNIFQMICGVPWNKIYKKDFIQKNNIRFSSSHHHNDTAFVMSAIIGAQNVLYIDKKLINYRIINSSLCHKKTSHPDSLYKSLTDIYSLIKNFDNYDLVQSSYFSHIVNMCIPYYNEAPKHLKSEVLNYIYKIYKKFEFDKYPTNYFCNQKNFITLKQILTTQIVRQNKINFEPKVSIIIPIYNVEEYLRECLDSVINQTMKEIEIICVDDGSTDSSLEILKEYAEKDNRITVITKVNQGLSHSRNTGIKLAKGKYIGFVDSDDWINKEFYEELYNSAEINKADICAGNILRTNKNNQQYYSHFTSVTNANTLEEKFKLYNIPLYCYVHNKIYLKDKIIENNLFFIDGIYYEDMFWTPTVLKTLGRCSTAPKSIYYYRINQKSICAQTKFGTKQQTDFFNGQRFVEKFIEEHQLSSKTFKSKINIILPLNEKYTPSDYQSCIESLLKHKPYGIFYKINILSNHSLDINFIYKHTLDVKLKKFEELYQCQLSYINYEKEKKLNIEKNYEHHFYFKQPIIISTNLTEYSSPYIDILNEQFIEQNINYLVQKYHLNQNENTITVKNAEGDPDTTAEILIQNKIDYTPKVSVIIPVYNAEEYLRKCLDSVVNQTLKEIEIICVDDGSTDSSLEILKEYAERDNRFTIITQKNLHAGVARNAGLSVTKGEYVHFLDSDDWIDLNTYEELYKTTKKENINFVKFKSYTYDNKEQKIISNNFTDIPQFAKNCIFSIDKNPKESLYMSDTPWSGIYKNDFIQNNNIRFDNLICSNDVSFFYRCLVKSRDFYFIAKPYVYYRVNNSKSLIGIRPYHFDCQITQFYNIQKITKSENIHIKSICNHRFSDAILRRFKEYYSNIDLDANTKQNILNLTNDFFEKNNFLNNAKEFNSYKKRTLGYIDNIKVSVIIPVYNVEKYIKECLDSVINQTIEDIEIICVNDESTDNSLKILNDYAQQDKRIKIINQKNSGPSKARNTGAKEAKGNYLYFIDSDDFIEKHCLEQLYQKTYSEKSDICMVGAKSFDDISKKTIINSYYTTECYKKREKLITNYNDIKSAIFRRYAPFFIFYKREFFINNNLFFPEDISLGEDLVSHVKAIILAQSISVNNDNVYNYRINRKDSIMNLSKSSKKIFDVFKYINYISNFLMKDNLYKQLEKEYIDFVFEQLTYHIDRTKNDEIKKEFIEKSINFTSSIKNINSAESTYKMKYDKIIKNAKISVIIPIYNTEKYLRECLDSVVNQTHKVIEIICVNDGSTDSSLKILEEYAKQDKRIIVINQKNQGLSCSRNNALKIANGKYIVFLDSDDYLSSDALEKIYSSMDYQNLDMLSYSGVNVNNITKEKQINNYWEFLYLPQNFNLNKFTFNDCKNFAHRMAVSSCLTAYRFEFLEQNKIEFPPNIYFEDNLFFTKALTKAKSIGLLKEKLYFRRMHENQITHNWEKNFSDFLKIVDLVLTYLKSIKIEEKIYLNYYNKCSDVIQWQYNKFSAIEQKKYKKEIDKVLKKHNTLKTKEINPIKSYLFFPVYLFKNMKLKKKIHKKVCRIIRNQLSKKFENTYTLTKQQIRDFVLKNNPTNNDSKKNIKRITNDVYDKFHFRKKHRILGIKFYTKNKHKELVSLLNYTIKRIEKLERKIKG